jgi:hypothetical protein
MPSVARTCVAFANFSQIGEASLEIAARLDAAKVPVVPVRAHDVLPFPQCVVCNHLDRHADRADRATLGAEGLADLLLLGRPEVLAQGGQELHLVEPVVTAHERKHHAAVRDDGHRLRRRPRVDAEELGDAFDRPLSRSLDLLRLGELFREVRR